MNENPPKQSLILALLLVCSAVLFLESSYDILSGGYVGYSSIWAYVRLLLSSSTLVVFAYEVMPGKFEFD